MAVVAMQGAKQHIRSNLIHNDQTIFEFLSNYWSIL